MFDLEKCLLTVGVIVLGIVINKTFEYFSYTPFTKEFKDKLIKDYEDNFNDYIYELNDEQIKTYNIINENYKFVVKEEINIDNIIIIPKGFICDLSSNNYTIDKKYNWILYLLHDWFYATRKYNNNDVSKNEIDKILIGIEEFLLHYDILISPKYFESSYKEYKDHTRILPENILNKIFYTRPNYDEVIYSKYFN